ncbi:MAG: aminotransferase class I/II-fold pyridoxal phosphate-dependent enzyme [Candidatus Daviesbacteria bacterium]|nr:aminotransferase class I/II-fold pyridoxal phosphate-dependent enzyme [Candidatus Daviesbacteria bacterium]
MKNPFKIIACDLGPNIFWEDVLLSIKLLFNPKKNGIEIKNLEEKFSQKFGTEAISFNSGRTSLMAILKSLGLQNDDEIAIQAYTCVAVPDAILWSGYKPIFIDIDESNFNLDPRDLEKKITKNTKAVIIQHTFGIPAPIKEIVKIANKYKLFIIEDCAHATGVKHDNEYLGKFSDAAFFSFGRDKMMSSVYGGMVITQNKILAERIKQYQEKLEFPSKKWIIEQLFYNPLIFVIVQTYGFFNFGKIIHLLSKKLKLLSKAVIELEKKGGKPEYFPKKMPASLARLALSQFERLDIFNVKRLNFNKYYQEELRDLPIANPAFNYPLLRFTIKTNERDKIKIFAQKFGIYLDTWYDQPVAPKGTDFNAVGYKINSCKVAEEVAKESLNLPVNPNLSKKDIEKVVAVLNKYYAKS